MTHPIPKHRSRDLFQRLNVYLPWDALKKRGDTFFIPSGTAADRSAIYMAASRRGIRVRTQERVEAQGSGLRVWRK